jgi:bifunctional DNA-binding transcriptional regulator/antitoxin component of YhaV-PrlF toxin-antitoxin module
LNQINSISSATDYLQALEYKIDENGETILPTKFRSRCRVGRGGRMIIDRIPVGFKYFYRILSSMLINFQQIYGDDNDDDDTIPQVWQYPVSLRSHSRWIPNCEPSIDVPSSTLSMKLTTASLHAHNNSVDTTEIRAPHRKVLPEFPLSNRKLFLQSLRRNSKINPNNWSSSLPMICQSIPPLFPAARVALSSETISKLESILAESDSEDERIIIPKTTEGFDVGKSQKVIFFC